MTPTDLQATAQALVSDGKGLLAADETVSTVTKRLDVLKIESTPDSRRAYREMFFATRGMHRLSTNMVQPSLGIT